MATGLLGLAPRGDSGYLASPVGYWNYALEMAVPVTTEQTDDRADIPTITVAEAEQKGCIVACALVSEATLPFSASGIARCGGSCGRPVFWLDKATDHLPHWCLDCIEVLFKPLGGVISTDTVFVNPSHDAELLEVELEQLRVDHGRAERYEAGLRGEIQQLQEQNEQLRADLKLANDGLEQAQAKIRRLSQ